MFGGLFIYENHRRSARDIVVVENPPAKQRRSYRFEIPGTYLPDGDQRIFAKTLADLPLKAEITDAVASGKRQKTHKAGSLHRGNSPDTLQREPEKRRLLFRLSVAAGWQSNRNVRTPCGANPRLTSVKRAKLSISNPAPVSSTSAAATSATISAERNLPRFPPPDEPRSPSFKDSCNCLPAACIAGARPKTIAVTAHKNSANKRTVGSTRTSARRGTLVSFTERNNGISPDARPIPSTPPENASTKLSESSCATIRPRDAPNAFRRASSFSRAVPRASKRFATFAHAMSKTSPTAPSSTSNERRVPPTRLSWRDSTSRS